MNHGELRADDEDCADGDNEIVEERDKSTDREGELKAQTDVAENGDQAESESPEGVSKEFFSESGLDCVFRNWRVSLIE